MLRRCYVAPRKRKAPVDHELADLDMQDHIEGMLVNMKLQKKTNFKSRVSQQRSDNEEMDDKQSRPPSQFNI